MKSKKSLQASSPTLIHPQPTKIETVRMKQYFVPISNSNICREQFLILLTQSTLDFGSVKRNMHRKRVTVLKDTPLLYHIFRISALKLSTINSLNIPVTYFLCELEVAHVFLNSFTCFWIIKYFKHFLNRKNLAALLETFFMPFFISATLTYWGIQSILILVIQKKSFPKDGQTRCKTSN